MGVHANIGLTKFPRQGDLVGREVRVCFDYQADLAVKGYCVRDDAEDPWLTIFRLPDGRHVLATECQYSPYLTPA